MTKKWLITKNVLAIVLMLLALSFLYMVLPVFSHTLERLSLLMESDDVLRKLAIFPLIKFHSGILGHVVRFWGAYWLLRGKSEGWLLSVIMAIFSVLSGVKSLFAEPSVNAEPNSGLHWALLLGLFVQLTITVLLLMKPIRSAYRPDRAAWLVAIVITSIHILLQFIFH